jgi:hypothetical protein
MFSSDFVQVANMRTYGRKTKKTPCLKERIWRRQNKYWLKLSIQENHLLSIQWVLLRWSKGKSNCKVKLSLCLIISALRYECLWRSGCIDPHFLDLGTSFRWVVSFTPRPLYPWGKSPGVHWRGGWVDTQVGLDDLEKRKLLTLPGFELRSLGRPALSQSLYRLWYPGQLQTQHSMHVITLWSNTL